MRKAWFGLLAVVGSMIPSLALAATVHASGFLRPLILIAVVLIFVIVIIWALNYWAAEIPAPLGKVIKFAVIFIALIIVIVILLGLAGIHVT